MPFAEGDPVEVRGMNGAVKYCGVVHRAHGRSVAVIPDGKHKPKPEPAMRVRRLERSAPTPTPKLTRKPDTSQPPPAPVQRRRKPARSATYLDYIRGLSCCACGAPAPSEAHHWDEKATMAKKVSDFFTVPLCASCHDRFHDTGKIHPRSADHTRDLFRHHQRVLMERAMSNQLANRGRR